ncbi:MAG: TIGR03943 family protein [Desulfosporosinus sp.]|nr:TIGR03943 family protein [Desulfosporosinus sp.]
MRIQRGFALVQGSILSGLSLMIVHLIQTGTIVLYISPKVIWLSKFSAILLIIIAIAKLIPMHPNHSVAHSCCGHDHACVSDHHNPSHKTKGLLQIAIFVIPIMLGFGMQPRVLASTALSNSINTAGTVPFYALHIPKNMLSSVKPLTPKSLNSTAKETDLMQLYLNLDDHPELVYNQHWRLSGFVYKDPKLAKNQFVISRFVITCCIVDATPIGIIVESTNAPNLKADTWVEVEGLLQKRIIGGADKIKSVRNFHETDEGVPYLVVTGCKIVATPKSPYLAPPMQ